MSISPAHSLFAYDELTRAVIGAAIEVHRALGPGFVESSYEEALAIELADRCIPFLRQPCLPLLYKDRVIGECRLDLLVDRRLVLELKAVETLLPVHHSQLLAYLKATRLRLGLLINFNVRALWRGIHRIAN